MLPAKCGQGRVWAPLCIATPLAPLTTAGRPQSTQRGCVRTEMHKEDQANKIVYKKRTQIIRSQIRSKIRRYVLLSSLGLASVPQLSLPSIHHRHLLFCDVLDDDTRLPVGCSRHKVILNYVCGTALLMTAGQLNCTQNHATKHTDEVNVVRQRLQGQLA